MDHLDMRAAVGVFPGFRDKYSSSRRATGIYIPRFRNVKDEDLGYVRGFGYQGGAERASWQLGTMAAGIGEDMKSKLRKPGPWVMSLTGFGEMLPDERNRVWLDEGRKDPWGIPTLNIDCEFRENERAMLGAMAEDAVEIMEAAGFTNIRSGFKELTPGLGIHEMGTARMGHDPDTSVLNANNQAHDVPNLFVTDGSCMTSSACQNPSLTYMALTARAAAAAVDMLKEGKI
jgi:choline dehydrogenase-like flavoprotein